MKKVLALILSFLYLGTATGTTLHMHYCMGELVDVRFWHDDAQTCGKCGPAPGSSCSKDCCKDVHKTVKLAPDHKASEQPFVFLQVELWASPLPVYTFPQVRTFSQETAIPAINAPPRCSNVPHHILHCTFRI